MIGKIRRSAIGSMRHRITVQDKTTEQDEALQPVESWSNTLVGEPASYDAVSGGQMLRQRQVVADATVVFVVNYQSDYNTRQRVVFDGQNYDVLRVHVPEGVKRFCELECKATGV